MKYSIKYFFYFIFLMIAFSSCEKNNYQMGALTAPTDIVINTIVAGQDAAHPNGDGSGDVKINITGKDVLAYKIDYDASDGIVLDALPGSTVNKKYTSLGLNKYMITVVAYGKGGTATTVTKEVEVRSDFTPDPQIVADLIGTGSKTWKINKDVAGHFGVGPWSVTSVTPDYYSAGPNEKAGCCNCFYTASFTFSKDNASGTYKLVTATPDGAFTKTGALAGGLPGIPSSGGEACYSYGGGSSAFSFVPPGSGIAASASTGTAILLSGNTTFIGYGAVQKEYEILSISSTLLTLRVRGTETANAWYMTLKAE